MDNNLHTLVRVLGQLGLVWPDRTSVTASLGRNWTSAEHIAWALLVRRTFSQEALKVGYALFGRQLQLDDLGHLAHEPQAWAARASEAAGFAPLLAPFVRVRTTAPADLAGLRHGALRRGLAPSAWKWLRRQRAAAVAKLFAFGWTPECIWWANLLSRALPHRQLDPRWLELGRPYLLQRHYEFAASDNELHAASAQALNLERFLRLLPQQCDAKSLVEYEMLSAGILVGLQDARYGLCANPGRTWSSMLQTLRRHNDTRTAMALREAKTQDLLEQGHAVSWEPVVGSLTHRGVHVRELCSHAELLHEGILMAHCVGNGTYTPGCASGAQSIFSLSEPLTGSRATLQLRRDGHNTWRITQLGGPGNCAVPSLFWRVARELASGALSAQPPLAAAA